MGEMGRNGEGGSGRWCPTKEQIEVLESLYKEGVRTPSTEQIQQITGKLLEFGSIEGKNVFYWFQNHKARQRQRQKQENFAYFTRLIHRPPPPPVGPPGVLPQLRTTPAGYYRAAMPSVPPCTNVICSPFYVPGNVGYHQQTHHHPNFAKSLNRYPNSVIGHQKKQFSGPRNKTDINSSYYPPPYYQNSGNNDNDVVYQTDQVLNHPRKTLELFPLHPTGFQEDKSTSVRSHGSFDDDDLVREGVGGLGSAESVSLFNFLQPAPPMP